MAPAWRGQCLEGDVGVQPGGPVTQAGMRGSAVASHLGEASPQLGGLEQGSWWRGTLCC